jgi:hypothetical protein
MSELDKLFRSNNVRNRKVSYENGMRFKRVLYGSIKIDSRSQDFNIS